MRQHNDITWDCRWREKLVFSRVKTAFHWSRVGRAREICWQTILSGFSAINVADLNLLSRQAQNHLSRFKCQTRQPKKARKTISEAKQKPNNKSIPSNWIRRNEEIECEKRRFNYFYTDYGFLSISSIHFQSTNKTCWRFFLRLWIDDWKKCERLKLINGCEDKSSLCLRQIENWDWRKQVISPIVHAVGFCLLRREKEKTTFIDF